MDSPFPVRLRAAAIIPRWSIVHHIQQDYLSSHSWFVSLYAHQIAHLIGWTSDLKGLLYEALTHDVEEVIISDIVGPVKREIVDPQRASHFISRKMDELMPGLLRYDWVPQVGAEVKLIIKAADQLDALLYAIGEQVLGNGIIAARIPSCYDKLREAWFKLPGCDEEGFVPEPMTAEEGFRKHVENYQGETTAQRVPKKLADLWLDVVVSAINEHRDPLRYDIGK